MSTDFDTDFECSGIHNTKIKDIYMRRDQITPLKSYTNVTPLNIVLLDAYFSNLIVGL